MNGWKLSVDARTAHSFLMERFESGTCDFGVWLYQLTDDGLAPELTAKGTKYYQNDELN